MQTNTEPIITRVYLDLESEDLSGNVLLQISLISEKGETFNIYINPHKELSYHCFRFTNLHFYQGNLYKRNLKVESVNIFTALKELKTWLENLKSDVSIVAYNGMGFDNAVLVKHFKLQNIEFPSCVKIFEDPLPCLKKHFKANKPENFKLETIAKIFNVELLDAHNSIDDSNCLKKICEQFCKLNSISIEEFLKPYSKSADHYLKPDQNATKKQKQSKKFTK